VGADGAADGGAQPARTVGLTGLPRLRLLRLTGVRSVRGTVGLTGQPRLRLLRLTG
jgi:hypothetical protein